METICFSNFQFCGFITVFLVLACVALFLFWTKTDLKEKIKETGKVVDSKIAKLEVEYYNAQLLFSKALLGALRSGREISQDLIMHVSRAVGKFEERTKNDKQDFSSRFTQFCKEINLLPYQWGDSYFSSLSQIPPIFTEIENDMYRLHKWRASSLEWEEVFFTIISTSKKIEIVKKDLVELIEKQKEETEFSKNEEGV